MAENLVFAFGKHRGKSFEDVVEEDKGYCRWVLKELVGSGRVSGQMKEFVTFLQARKGTIETQISKQNHDTRTALGSKPARCNNVTRPERQPQSQPPSEGPEGTLYVEISGPSEFKVYSTDYINSKIWREISNWNLGTWYKETREWVFPVAAYRKFIVNSLSLGHDLEFPPDWVLEQFPQFLQLTRTCAGRASKPQIANFEHAKCVEELPKKTQDRLMPYQREGITFGLSHKGRCLLGDEMGLGKTLQALGIISHFRKEWPCLVIVPSSLRFVWREQILEWLDGLEPQQVQVLMSGKEIVSKDALFVVVSYNLLSKQERFHKRADGGHYLVTIVDESQFMKEFKSQRSKATVTICKGARRAILLSGTPALNRSNELYTQLDALMPAMIPHFKAYAQRYCQSTKQHFSGRTVEKWTGSKCKGELNALLRNTVMIRRLKKDVLKELPDKTRQRVGLDASQMDKSIIKKLEEKKREMEEARETQKLPEKGTKAPPALSELFKLSAEAKVGAVLDHIEMLLDDGELKFLCFAHHHFMMEKVVDKLKSKDVPHIRIDGNTPQEQRAELVTRFQQENNVRVAVLSITACGQGLTLTAASTVVFTELYWVPGQLLQAEDRVHRMGQKNACLIQYLIAPGTLDDHIFRMVDRKNCNITGILDGTEIGIMDTTETGNSITSHVNQSRKHGADSESFPVSDNPTVAKDDATCVAAEHHPAIQISETNELETCITSLNLPKSEDSTVALDRVSSIATEHQPATQPNKETELESCAISSSPLDDLTLAKDDATDIAIKPQPMPQASKGEEWDTCATLPSCLRLEKPMVAKDDAIGSAIRHQPITQASKESELETCATSPSPPLSEVSTLAMDDDQSGTKMCGRRPKLKLHEAKLAQISEVDVPTITHEQQAVPKKRKYHSNPDTVTKKSDQDTSVELFTPERSGKKLFPAASPDFSGIPPRLPRNVSSTITAVRAHAFDPRTRTLGGGLQKTRRPFSAGIASSPIGPIMKTEGTTDQGLPLKRSATAMIAKVAEAQPPILRAKTLGMRLGTPIIRHG